MNIAELARMAEVPVRTIRYYADRGLLRPARRTDGGYRVFDEGALRQLRFIRRTQALGMSLGEIVPLLRAAERLSCGQSSHLVVKRLTNQLEIVEQKLADLEAVRHELRSLITGRSSECSDELCLCNVASSS